MNRIRYTVNAHNVTADQIVIDHISTDNNDFTSVGFDLSLNLFLDGTKAKRVEELRAIAAKLIEAADELEAQA